MESNKMSADREAPGGGVSCGTGDSPPVEILLFGDSTANIDRHFQQLLNCKGNPELQSLFDHASLAFRREFARLPRDQHEWFPRFTSMIDLVAGVEGSIGEPALRLALLCVYQVGLVLESSIQLGTTESYAIGACAGAFATTAVSVSRTRSQLVTAGVSAAVAAFRTGLCSLRTQRNVEAPEATSSRPWSLAVSSSEEDGRKMLDAFAKENALPIASRPYISAVSPTALTISGPPTTLDKLKIHVIAHLHEINVRSPYHAAHLFSPDDVEEIVSGLRLEANTNLTSRLSQVSLASGEQVESGTFPERLHNAVEDTLLNQMRWDKLCSKVKSTLVQPSVDSRFVIRPIASSAATILSTAIRRELQCEVAVSSIVELDAEQPTAEPSSGRLQDEKIAIIGFSGRYPDAASNEALWELLMSARDCHREIPKDRFDWATHYDPSGHKKNTSKIKHGCFIQEPGVFDARFFNISPREAENTDPAQRLALMAAYEAMEMGGVVPDRTPSTQRDRVGVFFGVTSDDWREVNSGQNIDTYFIPGGNRAFVPGRISYCFGLSGPSISFDTACSSSFAAISTACSYLKQGECDSAIAGGTNVLTNPDNFAGLDRGHFLSTTGNCNPFNDSADGYCRADAVGAVVLKRLSDAVADYDPIFGVISGASTNHCGSSVSITRPHEGDQLSLFRRILRQSNTGPLDVSYVEMHGTGTQAGDATEMGSVLSAMAWDKQRAGGGQIAPRPLHLGAVKANVGHSESASGVTALIKVLLMMQHSQIPPHRLQGPLNRHYPADLTARNVHIALGGSRPWRREDCPSGRRTAFLNNFSAAGGNTALLVEDPNLAGGDVADKKDSDPRTFLPVVVSAKTRDALSANINALVAHLTSHSHISLPALSYTTTARRSHYNHRVLVNGGDVADIVVALRKRDTASIKPVKHGARKIAFCFTGQGSLYYGMGRQLFQSVDSFRTDILSFDRLAQHQGFPSFLSLVQDGESTQDATDVPPVKAQLALTCVQMALARLMILWGVTPTVITAHSLGEYAALHIAGVLSASDAIYLVGSRAQLLSKHCVESSHAMLAIKAPLHSILPELERTACTVACINSPVNTVVSGDHHSIDQFAATLKAKGLDVVLLQIPFAFHSSQMDSILAAYEHVAAAVTFNKPTLPYLSALLAEAVTDGGVLDASYVVRATRDCVDFQGAVEAGRTAGLVNDTTMWMEIGAHPACSSMIKQTLNPSVILSTLRKASDTWKILGEALEVLYTGGADIQWEAFHGGFDSSHQLIALPSYQWDLKNYWIDYRHDFCLYKGDDPKTLSGHSHAAEAPSVDVGLSSSVHTIIEMSHTQHNSEIVTQTDLHDPRLWPVIQGHQVNGSSLCPSSLYADMALTVAHHLISTSGSHKIAPGLDCGNMKIGKALIAQPDRSSELLRVSANADWLMHNISLRFFSVEPNGKERCEHATCDVKVTESPAWTETWKRATFMIQAQIARLEQSRESGAAHFLNRGLVYKLFGNLVEYADTYQGMQRVILNSDAFEATARVKFRVDSAGYDLNPCWIDSLGHIAGFIMNATDNIAAKDLVFVNHGWDAMRLAIPLSREKTYTTYNRMHLETGTTYVGDTYVLEGGAVIGVIEGVRFQGIKRSVLQHLLPGKKLSVAPTTKPGAARVEPVLKSATQALPSSAPTTKRQDPILDKTSIILRTIAEEAQILPADVDLDAEFSDLGIDSLLSLNVADRLRTKLDLEISSTTFLAFPTIREFLHSLAGKDALEGAGASPASRADTGTFTPRSLDDEDVGYSTGPTSVSSECLDVGSGLDVARKVISEQTGVPIEDIQSDSALIDLGIDSLMGLDLLNMLSESLQTSLAPDLFAESETVGDVEKHLREVTGLAARDEHAASDAKPFSNRQQEVVSVTTDSVSQQPHASSVLLQGSPRKAERKLFLFPDGAGSAASYMYLPNISSTVAVYGLSCPWLKTPQNLKCSLEQYVSKFLIEVRRIQESGPYCLGGASAGGILAYEAAVQLAAVGESVEKLVLMDTPNPIGLENPNSRMYDFLDSMGMFGMTGQKTPTWLRPHFDAFLALLDKYDVQTFDRAVNAIKSASSNIATPAPPETHIIYARDGMCKNTNDPRPELHQDDPREMLWLINNRTDFSGAGWNKLVGKEKLSIAVLDNVNHYTILQPGPGVEALSRMLAKALER